MNRTPRTWGRKAKLGTGSCLVFIIGSLLWSCGSAQTEGHRCVQVHFVTASDHVDVTEQSKLTSEPEVADTEASAPASSHAEMVASGKRHSCALMEGGIKCWGDNTYGQLGDGTTQGSPVPVQVVGLREAVFQVTCGDFHTCARTKSGAVLCWGRNDRGQLGVGTYDHSLQPLTVLWDPKTLPREKKKSGNFPRKRFREKPKPTKKSQEIQVPGLFRNDLPKKKRPGRDVRFSHEFGGPEENPFKQRPE